jgi:DNA-binding SARP family transcriptional activator
MMHRLRSFGRTEIQNEAGDTVSLRSQKHLALLLYLASHRERRHSRERLASLFWTTESRLARHSLSQALYDIQSQLPRVGLDRTVNRVGLGSNGLAFDAEDFERSVRENDLQRAVDLYDGEFAPDLELAGTDDFERWLEGERHRLRRLAEMVLLRHVGECDDRARWGEMCVAAVHLLDMNPLNEQAHRALMRGLWLQGDQGSAVRHFEEVEEELQRELPEGISPETHELVSRIRSSRPGGTASAVQEELRPEMVGREPEFGVLRQALADSRDGQGRFVVVEGEAGMGKTRLLQEFGELAALEDVRLLQSRCYAAESEVPYGPVVDGLAEFVTELSSDLREDQVYHQLGHLFPAEFGKPDSGGEDSSNPDIGRRRLYEELTDLLRKGLGSRPIVWIVEDVHWADRSSVSLINYIHRRLADRPLLIVVSQRTHEETSYSAQELGSGSGDEARKSVTLGRLATTEVADLTRAVGLEEYVDRAERIAELAGGNPFYALEILRSLKSVDDQLLSGELSRSQGSRRLMTEGLRKLISHRLQGLDPSAIHVLEVVAVAGRHARPHVVARTAGLGPAELEEVASVLYRRSLLEDHEEVIVFSHDIIRSYAYGEMGSLQRAALHQSVGEVLAGRPEVSPATLAYHFKESGDYERANEYAITAAERSEAAYGHQEAVRLGKLALSTSRQPAARARTLKTLARAEMAAGLLTAATSHLEELVATGEVDTEERIDLRLALVEVLIESYRAEEAEEQLDKIEAELAEAGADDRQLTMQALLLRLRLAIFRDNAVEAKSTVNRVMDLRESIGPENLGPVADCAAVCSVAAYQVFHVSAAKAMKLLSEGNWQLKELPSGLQVRYLALLAIAEARSCRWDQAKHYCRRAGSVAEKHNDLLHIRTLLNNRTVIALEQGNWLEAERAHGRIVKLTSGLPEKDTLRAYNKVNLANAYFYSGRARDALPLYENVQRETDAKVPWKTPEIRASIGLVAIELQKRGYAKEMWLKTRQMSLSNLIGVQDRFKIAWLNAYMVLPDDKEQALLILDEAIEREEHPDPCSHLKLLWLRNLAAKFPSLEISDGNAQAVKAQLQEAGMGWFVYFSRRWLRRAMRIEAKLIN